MNLQVKELKTEEIISLIADLDIELQSRMEVEKAKLIDEIRARAAALNIPVEYIMEEVAKPRKRTIQPKYQNPDNENEKWVGRGNKPSWVLAQLAKGKNLEDLRI